MSTMNPEQMDFYIRELQNKVTELETLLRKLEDKQDESERDLERLKDNFWEHIRGE